VYLRESEERQEKERNSREGANRQAAKQKVANVQMFAKAKVILSQSSGSSTIDDEENQRPSDIQNLVVSSPYHEQEQEDEQPSKRQRTRSGPDEENTLSYEFNLKCVGMKFREHGTDWKTMTEGLKDKATVFLRRDPLNEKDHNAIKVYIINDGQAKMIEQLGFVAKSQASLLAAEMDDSQLDFVHSQIVAIQHSVIYINAKVMTRLNIQHMTELVKALGEPYKKGKNTQESNGETREEEEGHEPEGETFLKERVAEVDPSIYVTQVFYCKK